MRTDEELMLACRQGSGEAFAELFKRYRQPMWAFFRRRVLNAARAEDMAQEVFVAVLKAARRYEPLAPVRTYLFGIAFNVLASDRRRGRDEQLQPGVGEVARATGVTDVGLWVRQALGRLDDADREIVMLREFEQLSYAEIAALLEIPLNTVRSRLFRARTELRRLLELDQTEGSHQ